ncbi:MAG: VWA domain-containing protein [Spirochaetaceae bacterium]|nr:VWA domain-containing protein [Spirochaetaceae bacterium]
MKENRISIHLLFLFIVAFLAVFMPAACGGGIGYAGSGPAGSGDGGYGSGPEAGDGENGNQSRPSSGQLTCGEWSDIKNYDFYLNLFTIIDDPNIEESQRRNDFYKYINYFGFETRYMFTVNVESGGLPAGDAIVELYDSDNKLFAAKTDVLGNAYMFPSYDLSGETVTVKVTSGGAEYEEPFIYTQADMQITLDSSAAKESVLDILFLIDTTGSMGDELRYLKSEISDVIGNIAASNPNYTINLALLFYRDIGDDYVTRYFDFTTNIEQQQTNLAKQSANGGGDFPEAVDRALAEAVGKNWSDDYAMRLIFHVCDAPPHDKQENKTLYYNSIKTAAQKGIRIIPVASSGIDFATEYLLRQEALMTGGTYIFLTDDSGIGNSHLQATVGEYTVEYLNDCMVRIVNEYLTGIATEPVPYY